MQLYKILLIFVFFHVITLNAELPTYWEYSENELNALRQIEVPKQEITEKAIAKWDDTAYQLTSRPLPDGLATRFFAYLYTAQRDAAYLSYNVHQRFLGTLDPITSQVITFFFPDYRIEQKVDSDPFSNEVAKIVLAKVKERFGQEQNHLKEYEARTGKEYWDETEHVGRRVGSSLTWIAGPVEQFRLPEPPSSDSIIWSYGLNQIRDFQSRVGSKEKNVIDYWGSLQGPKSGSWFAVANDYLENLSPPVPLKDFLFIRSIYAMCLTDALIAVFDNKYRFWVLRPHMLDPSLKTLIDVPKHPSYPSGHSVISAAAATVLSHFFPNDAKKWRSLAIEAGDSRIAGGLHYMIDNESGLMLGEKVGKAVIRNQR